MFFKCGIIYNFPEFIGIFVNLFSNGFEYVAFALTILLKENILPDQCEYNTLQRCFFSLRGQDKLRNLFIKRFVI